MSDPLIIAPGERGILRLFALDMTGMADAQARAANEPRVVEQMLGVADLDRSQVDIVNIAELSGIGLAGYLIDGFAISSDQLDLPALTALTGNVLLIRSRAFRGRATTLKPAPQLTLIATYTEPATDWSTSPMQTDGARPRLSPRATRSQARRLGAALFAVVMVLLVLLVTWMAT